MELDVDFIGGQGALTLEEEKALSDFFLKQKVDKRELLRKKTPLIIKRQKSTV